MHMNMSCSVTRLSFEKWLYQQSTPDMLANTLPTELYMKDILCVSSGLNGTFTVDRCGGVQMVAKQPGWLTAVQLALFGFSAWAYDNYLSVL